MQCLPLGVLVSVLIVLYSVSNPGSASWFLLLTVECVNPFKVLTKTLVVKISSGVRLVSARENADLTVRDSFCIISGRKLCVTVSDVGCELLTDESEENAGAWFQENGQNKGKRRKWKIKGLTEKKGGTWR